MVDIQYDIIIMGGREVSRPYRVGFSPKASGFYPWGNVDSPRKRVAEGLCGWRHGNSFPMTQSAQSHRQMRSIPLCSKAVFHVLVFDFIADSATMLNPSPSKFPTEPKKCSRGCHLGCWGKIILMLDYCSLARAVAMRVVASTMFSSLVA